MFTPVLLLTALAGASIAQSTTASPSGPVVSIFLPDTDSQSLVASVVGSSNAVTTYVITCPEGTDQNECGFDPPVTVTAASNTFHMTQTVPDFTASIDCTLQGTTAGVCTESFGGSEANFQGLSTTTLSAADITFFPVLVTAGAVGGSQTAGTSSGATTTTASSTLLSGTISSTGSASGLATASNSAAATTSANNSGGADHSFGQGLQVYGSCIGLGLVGILLM